MSMHTWVSIVSLWLYSHYIPFELALFHSRPPSPPPPSPPSKIQLNKHHLSNWVQEKVTRNYAVDTPLPPRCSCQNYNFPHEHKEDINVNKYIQTEISSEIQNVHVGQRSQTETQAQK